MGISERKSYELVRGLCRGINEFKKGHQPRTNIVNENGDLFPDSHGILNRWKNYSV
jgi:hypothetical protein